jgi:hypothetical protein
MNGPPMGVSAPPPPPMMPSSAAASAAPSPSPNSALLAGIQGFGKSALKKVVTVDKSSPIVGKKDEPAAASAAAAKPAAGGMGGLMAQMQAKLAGQIGRK